MHAASPCADVIRASTSPERRLQMLAAFSIEVALAVRATDVLARRRSIEALLQRFGSALNLERNVLKVYLELGDEHASALSEALGVSAPPNAGPIFDDELSTLTLSPLNRPEASLVLKAGVVTLNRLVTNNGGCNAVLKRAIDILQRAFNFQRVMLYSTLEQAQVFSLRAVAGKPVHNAATQCLQGVSQNRVLGQALRKNIDLYIRSASDDARGESWNHWFDLLPDAKSFFLLPIINADALIGVFYADYPRSHMQGWTGEELELLQTIKQVAGLALTKPM